MYVGSLFVCQNLFGRFERLNLSDMSYDTFDDCSSASKASSYSYEDDQQNFSFDDAQKSDLRSAGISDDLMEQAEGYARQHSKKSGSWLGGSQVLSEEGAYAGHNRSWFNMSGISSGLSAAMSLAMMFVLKQGYDTYVSKDGRDQLIKEAVAAAKTAVKDDEDFKPFITEDGRKAMYEEFGNVAGSRIGEKALEAILANPKIQQFTEEESQNALVDKLSDRAADQMIAKVLANPQVQQFTDEAKQDALVDRLAMRATEKMLDTVKKEAPIASEQSIAGQALSYASPAAWLQWTGKQVAQGMAQGVAIKN